LAVSEGCKALVDEILATEPDALKVTPGKIVFELDSPVRDMKIVLRRLARSRSATAWRTDT